MASNIWSDRTKSFCARANKGQGRRKSHGRVAIAAVAAAWAMGSAGAQAAFKTWDGGAATVSWNDANNWNSNGLPSVSDDGILLDNSSVGTLPASMTMSNLDMTVKTIQINTTNTFTVGSIGSGSSGNVSSWTINGDGTASNVLFSMSATSTGTVTFLDQISGNRELAIALGASGTIDVGNSAGTLVLNAAISGASRSITKIGSGTLRLGRANTYTGGTTISAGTLDLTGSLSSTGTLAILSGGTITGTGTASGAAVLTGGTINTSGAFTFSSTFGTTGGNWNGTGAVTGTTTVSSGTLSIGAGASMTGAGGMTLSSGANLTGTGATGTVSKTVTLSGSNTLSSSGTLTLGAMVVNSTGNSISTGIISTTGDTISGALAVTGTLGGTGTAAVGTAGTLTGAGTINKNASVTGSGVINLSSGGTITGTLSTTGGTWSGLGSVTGNVNINSGTFTLSGTLGGGGTGIIATGATLAGTGTLSRNVTTTGTATINLGSGGTIGGTLLSDGGNWNGLGSVSGLTTLNSGTFSIGSSGNMNVFANGMSIAGGTLGGSGIVTGNASISSGAVNFTNPGQITGTLTATGGSWTGAGSVSTLTLNSGTFTLGAGANLTASTAANIGGGTLLGDGAITGTVNLTSGSIGLNSSGSIVGTLIATGGSWDSAGAVTGNVSVASGTLTIGASGVLTTSGAVNVSGTGALIASGSSVINGNVNYTASANDTFAGIISGAASTLTLDNAAKTLLISGANNYGGATIISAGTLQVAGSSVPNGSTVTLADAASAVLDLNGTSESIGALAGGGTTGGTVNLGSGALTLAGSASTDFSGSITGSGSVVKTGVGTQTFSSANNYSGGTTISAGTLLVNNTSGSATGSGAVTVNGGTLGGTGSITGGVIVNTAGHLAPGASIGTITLDTLTLNSGAVLDYEIGASSDTTVVSVASGLTLDSGSNTITLNVSALSGFGSGTFALLDYDTAYSGALGSLFLGAAPSGFDYSIVDNTTNTTIDLVISLQSRAWAVDADGSWSTGSNWTGGSDPNGQGSIADFTSAISAPHTVTLDATRTVNTINFANSNSYSIVGASTLHMDAVSGNATINDISGNHTVAAPVQLDKTTDIIVANGGETLTISGNISGAGTGINLSGGGTLLLSGANNYSGGTNVTGGVLRGAAGSIQGNIVNDSLVIFDQVTNGTYAGTMSGTGSLAKISSGTLVLSGANNYSGGTSVIDGVLQGNSSSIQGDVSNDASVVFDQSANGTYAGVMSGVGSLTKSNSGVLTLTGANIYSGGTTVTGGTLRGDTTSLQGNIVNNAIVNFNQPVDGVYTGNMSGTGALHKSAAGVLELTGANNYTGGTTVSAGTLKGALAAVQGNIVNNAAVVLTGTGNQTYAGNMSGTGALTSEITGTLLLTGSNNYSGGTTLNVGALQGSSASVQGAIVNNTAVIFDQILNGTYAGVMSGTGSMTKNGIGTLVLSGANNYSGGTTVSAGTLQGTTTSLQGNITNNNSVVFDQTITGTYAGVMSGTGSVTKNSSGSVTFTAANTYSGGTVVLGGNLLVNNVTGSGTGSGPVAVNGGTIGGTGTISGSVSITSGAHLAPGASAGTLTVGGLTLGSGSILDYELATTGASDKTVISTASGLNISGGTLNITSLVGFGTGTYTLLDYDTAFGGAMSNLTLGAHPVGFTYTFIDNTTNTSIDLDVVALTGNPRWGVNASGNWSTQTNWVAEVIPSGAGAVAEFSSAISTPQTVTLDGARTVGTVIFNNASAYTLSGSALHIDTISGNGTIDDQAGSHTISSALTLHKNTDVTVTGSGDTLTISGNITGVGFALSKAGAGTLLLSGTNNYSGGTTVSGGVLQGTTSSVQGAITNNSSVIFSQTSNGTYAGIMSGTGALTKSGTGIVTLTGANNYSGGTTVSAGTLRGSTTSLQGDIVNNATVNFDQAGAGTYAGVMSGTGALTKTSAGTVVLTGANNYTGGTTVTTGVIQGAAGSIQGNITNNANVTFDQPTAGTYAGNMSGSGSLNKINIGALTLSGTNSHTGGTNITGGTLNLTGTLGATGTLAVGTAGTLTGTGSTAGNATLTGSGVINTTAPFTIGGTLGVTGGSWNGNGTVTGNISVTSGSFVLGPGATLTNAATMTVSSTAAVSGSANSTFAGNISYTSSAVSAFAGVIAGVGKTITLNNSAANWTLSGANTSTGNATVTSGTLNLTGSLASATVAVATAGTLTGTGTVSNNATLAGSGVINFGAGGIIGGTLGVSGGNWSGLGSVSGLTTVSSGTFTVNGTLGGAGGVTLANGTTLAGTGTINKNVTTGNSATLSSTSTLTIGGTLSVPGTGNTITTGTISTTGDSITGALAVNGTLGGTGVTAVASGATLSGTGTINKNVTLTGTGAINLTNPGNITGTLGVTGGTWSGAGSVAGLVTVSSGTFTINASRILTASGGVSISGGTIAGQGQIAGSATMSSGAIGFSSAGTLTGTLTATGGSWTGLGSAGNVSVASGTLTIGPAANLTTGGTVSVSGTGAIIADPTSIITGNVNYTTSVNQTLAGIIAGSGKTLTLNNASTTLVLTGANNYTGGTTVSAGTLQGSTTSLQGAITNNSAVVFDQSTNGTYAGIMGGSGSLTKSNSGVVTLTAANAFGGGTTISSGTLLVNNVTGSGTGGGNVLVNGTLGGTGNISGTVVLNSSGHIAPGASIGTLRAGGATLLSGGVLDFELGAPTSSDVLDITLANGLTIIGGSVNLINAGGLGAGQYKLIDYNTAFNGSLASLGTPAGPSTLFDYALVNNTTGTSIDVVVTPGDRSWAVDASGNWSAGGNWSTGAQPNIAGAIANFTAAASTVDPTVTLDDGNKTVGTVNFNNSSRSYTIAGTNTLVINTIAGNGAINVTSGSHAISAPVALNKNTAVTVTNGADTLTVSNTVSGSFALSKAGAGSLVLSGANTYSGGTTVSSGTLRVNNASGSGTGSGAVAVNAGTLAGTGTISGAVTIASGATLAPGNSIGTLTVGNLTLASGSLLDYELAASPSGDQTVITSAGGLALSGGTFTFTDGGINAGSYTLLDYDTSYAGALGNLAISGSPPVGFNWSLVDNTTNTSIDLVVTSAGPNQWKDLDGTWGDTASWTNAIVPNAAGDTATFGLLALAPRTVTVEANKTAGTIEFNNANKYTLAGPGTVHVAGAVNVTSGSHDINAPVVLDAATTVTVVVGSDTLKVADFTATGQNLTKDGSGTLEVDKVRSNAALTVSAGTLKITSSGGNEQGLGTKNSQVSSLSMSGSYIDLTNNNLIIQSVDFADSVTKYAAAEALVISGFGNFDWLGTGIASSTAAAAAQIDGSRAVGIINNTDWGHSDIEGDPVGPNDIIIKYTWVADANVDGLVDNDDFGQFLFGFSGAGAANWLNGDFDYNGVVDNDDFGWFLTGLGAFNASGNTQLSESFKAELAAFASEQGIPLVLDPAPVPEPTTLGAIGLVGAGMLARRRRR